jgi:hypothetical protein
MMLALWLGHSVLVGGCAAVWLHRPARASVTLLVQAAGLGLGISAATEAVLLMLGVPGGPRWWQAQIVLAVAAAVALAMYPWPHATQPGRRDVRRHWLAALVLLALIATASIGLIVTAQLFPHGRWDGWAIWTLRAAFIYQAREQWRVAFDPLLYWSHLDYPLLLPLSIVRGWRFVGSDTMLVPRVVGVSCAVLLMLATAALVWQRRGAGWAMAAVAGVVSLGTFLQESSAQLADVPLALMALMSAAVFADTVRSSRTGLRQWAALGVWLGLAAWTKNEGVSLAIAFTLAAVIATLRRRPHVTIAGLLLGAAPWAALIAWQRLTLYGDTDVLQRTRPLADLLLDLERHGTIIRQTLAHLSTQGLAVGALLAMLCLCFVCGPVRGRLQRRAAMALGVALALHAAAAYGVYLITPHPLAWHIGESVHRLVLQVWPALLLLIALSARPLRAPRWRRRPGLTEARA